MLIKKMKYSLTAYHCPNCGGIGDPKLGKCLYCGGKFVYKPSQKRKARILVDGLRDYVYYENILELEVEQHPLNESYIDSNGYMLNRHVRTEGEIRFTIPATFEGIKRTAQLRESFNASRNVRIELLEQDLAFETKCYLGDYKVEVPTALSVARSNITLIQDDDIRQFDTVVPEGCTCPNCGAPIKSRYGCCDYCSGWVEWSF